MNQMPEESGKLFVVYRPSSDAKPSLSAVGQLNHKTPAIDKAAPALLMQGRPVYLAVP
jgi:hypothetical protein